MAQGTRSVARRLFAGFGFLLMLLAAVAALGTNELLNDTQRLNRIVEINNRRSNLARDLLDHIDAMAIQARTITLLTDLPGIDAEMKDLQTSAAAYGRTEDAMTEALAGADATDDERRLLADIAGLGKQALPSLLAAARQGSDGDNVSATLTLTTQARPVETRWRAKVAEFVRLQDAASGQGRGFAVVASEVRGLAKRSADAAREIKALIGGSVERVEAGARLVGEAGSTMTEIVASVRRVSDIIGEITHSADEQSSGIQQVNQAVTQLDQMTQQNSALVEQSAAAAASLKEQATRLAQLVGTFKLEHAVL